MTEALECLDHDEHFGIGWLTGECAGIRIDAIVETRLNVQAEFHVISDRKEEDGFFIHKTEDFETEDRRSEQAWGGGCFAITADHEG